MSTTSTNIESTDPQTLLDPFREKIAQIKSLKKWNTRTDEAFLLRFLDVAKNDLKKALKRYEDYYNVIAKLPGAIDIISRDKPKYQWLLDAMKASEDIMQDNSSENSDNKPMFAYYGKDKNDRHMLAYDVSSMTKATDVENFLEASLILSLILLDKMIEENPDINKTGVISLEEQSGFNMKLMKLWMSNMTLMSNFMKLMDGAFPLKISKVYIINGPKIIVAFFNLFKPFMSKKMIDKCHFVSDVSTVFDEIGGNEFVPDVLGGLNEFRRFDCDHEEQLMKIFPSLKEE